jgi:hypothetical protein
VDYFTSLYAGTTELLRTIPEDANQAEINETEVVEAIHKLKNHKSPVRTA